MANQPPEYQERVSLGAGPSPGIQPVPLQNAPSMPDLSSADKAMSTFGAELVSVAQKLNEGQQQTKASQAMEGFLGERAALQDQYVKDTNYETAPGNFAKDIDAAKMKWLEGVTDPKLRARMSLEMERDAISSGNKVTAASFGRQADTNVAALDKFEQSSLNEAVGAASEAERAAAITRYGNQVKRLLEAGWIDATVAARREQNFRGALEHADVLGFINRDPVKAKAALADPAAFPTLDPVKRQSLAIMADQKADTNNQAAWTQAAIFHPEAASLTMGRVVSADHALRIFDNGILKIETRGEPRAESKAGALGPSQIMPGTAREVATGLGLKDVAALSDADLKEKLLSDDALNLKLGRAYWSQMVTRYDGNVALAAAAYNAGPGRADKWKERAEAQFGAGFTPGQLASVVDIKETQDYLGKLYGRFNAPMNVSFSSPAAAMNASNAVGVVLTQQHARETHLMQAQATAAASSDDVVSVVRAGFDVDPLRISTWKATQQASAAKGDAQAAGRLRDLDFAEKTQPFIRQAWATPPSLLDTSIKNMEASITAPGANPSMQSINAVKAFKAVQEQQAKMRDSEPVVLGGENGGRYYALQPIDGRSELNDTLLSALKNRDAQARTANRIYGGNGSPFTVEEAQSWRERYADATPQERGQILGMLAKGLSADTFATALPQIIKGENSKSQTPALTIAAGLYGKSPAIAQSIIEGMNAVDTDGRYLPSDGANGLSYKTGKDQYLPIGAFNRAARTDPNGPVAAMSAAIDARYAFLSAQAKDQTGAPNSSRLKQAIDDVTGGILYHNGAAVIAPVRGMDQRRFDATVFSLTDENLAGAQTTSGKAITADYVRGSAKLQARSDGQYYLQVNRDDGNPQYAVTKEGAPFVLDLRNIQITEPSRRDVSQKGTRAFRAELGDRLRGAAEENP